MTIGKKLTISFTALLGLTAALGLVSLLSLGKMGDTLDNTTRKVAKRADLAGAIKLAVADMRTGQRGLVLFSITKASDKQHQSEELFRSSARHLEGLMSEFRPLIVTESGRQSVNNLQSKLNEWQQAFNDLAQQCAKQQQDDTVFALLDKGVAYGQQMTDATENLLEIQRRFMAAAAEEGRTLYSRCRWSIILILSISLIVGLFGVLGVRRTSRTLQHAAADLSQNAEQVAGAAGQISSSSQALAQGASEQAASLEETSASSEQISAMTRKNADDSRTAAELMNETGAAVSEANRTLEQMEASMQEINSSSEKIGKIIKVIDEIAFQTNILALNAAVEAARAGDAGMGFAVVADEVRNLAQRSAQAAKDTANMIEGSISKSNEGRIKLGEVSKAIRAITERATKVKTLVDNVSVGSSEQAHGAEQISKAITQVERVVQTSAASAEEAASAGEELNSQAAALRAIAGKLEELVGSAH